MDEKRHNQPGPSRRGWGEKRAMSHSWRNPRNTYTDRQRNESGCSYTVSRKRSHPNEIELNTTKKPRMGFLTLQDLTLLDEKEIICQINTKKDGFMHLLSTMDRPDMFALVLQVLAKVCQSSFGQLKLAIILDVCNSPFVLSLRNYLTDLPYQKAKEANKMYWERQNEFWGNFLTFCDSVNTLSPSTALGVCRSMIEGTSKVCLEGLKERHDYSLPEELNSLLTQLREALTRREKEIETAPARTSRQEMDAQQEPPEDFRKLSVLPGREDLVGGRPYLRANVVSGGYRDVEHYLDVQFRLLREDCFGPLRDGIAQYIKDPKKKKYDNIRVFNNVKFVSPYVSQQKIGSIVEFDAKTKTRFEKINWQFNKRFIFGSLVIFTRDNCKNIIVATILDRDVRCLAQGQIPVSFICDNDSATYATDSGTSGRQKFGENLYDNTTYTMIESGVYFEPYKHVLSALKEPDFPKHLAMEKYIVRVDPDPEPPKYLKIDTTYKVTTAQSAEEFTVLDLDTWPSCEDLNLNESQYEAYKMALTREFAVIQGPPGTGKTYLGVNIATTLIKNLGHKSSGCLLLLVCYTNHALDQFLEALLPVTNSIIRVGGQSKNKAMEDISLHALRKTAKYSDNKLFKYERRCLKESVEHLQKAQHFIEHLNTCVIDFDSIRTRVPESDIIGEFYKCTRNNSKDPLSYWLFDNMVLDYDEPIGPEDEWNAQFENYDYTDDRNEVVIDDFNNHLEGTPYLDVKITFSKEETEKHLKMLCCTYNNVPHRIKRQIRTEIVEAKAYLRRFNEMKRYYTQGRRVSDWANLRIPPRVGMVDRWMLYFQWAETAKESIKKTIGPLQESVEHATAKYEESRMMADHYLMKNCQVIGMTTSGAARCRALVQALAPRIVMVEEAAEVLEQHIVTALTNKCEHLILIGDHQQLRPSASYMRLAKHYNIEVSLFERMILNKVHSRRLAVQHRMRPEIAALIAPAIYPDLENHPSVRGFPQVRGVAASVFFMTHSHKEQVLNESASKTNETEGDLVLGLANYLIQQDYEPNEVTILSAYSGQMLYMRRQRSKYSHLANVKITILDNYQGEESRIILLSLVRNNDDNKIGFLGTENRICVALSRAREGLYIFGNIEMLKSNSPLWTKIAATLEGLGAIGTSIRLTCETHETQISTISSPEDYKKVPEGGCRLMCDAKLPCMHACTRLCHGYDRAHRAAACREKCERTLCELGHVCPLLCKEKCKPCMEMVLKTLLCGHTKLMYCHVNVEDGAATCTVTVSAQLPTCGHEVEKPCYKDISVVSCPKPCGNRLERCGHACIRTCHVGDDSDHEQYLCHKPCARAKRGCSMDTVADSGPHRCTKRCHEKCDFCNVEVVKTRDSCKHKIRVQCSVNLDDVPCVRKCERVLPCGHRCEKECFETCGDCMHMVLKKVPECNHETLVQCSVEPLRVMCKQACERTLGCGHRCPGVCGDNCDLECKELTSHYEASPCGHQVQLSCKDYAAAKAGTLNKETLLERCTEPCVVLLACDDFCTGTCGACKQGRLHAPCTQPCHRIHICGHRAQTKFIQGLCRCAEPCNQLCPPCQRPCEVKCRHSKCGRLCGQPCIPCEERCTRRCAHGRCNRACGVPCARTACSRRCPRALPCAHPCRGLCGERCPPVCKLCRPADFPTDFLGDEFDDDAMFIVLEDCGHIMEFENMENLMKGSSEMVEIRRCPLCRKGIINTHRYKDLVNELIKKDINPIKERVYGTRTEINARRQELVDAVRRFQNTRHRVTSNDWTSAVDKILKVVKSTKKYSLLQLDMCFVYLNIMNHLSDIHKEFHEEGLSALKENLSGQTSMICQLLADNASKISQQQQADIKNEIKRMYAILNLSKIIGHSTYRDSKTNTKVMDRIDAAKSAILGWCVFKPAAASEALTDLQREINLSDVVIQKEREMIIRAIGATAGQWFKCPNGHFYSIGQCGGAMEESRCLECKQKIGGTRHKLLPTNQHAKEFDNSKFPAYSEEANNMANFDLNNII